MLIDANASTSARTKPSGESIFISASFLRPNDSSASNPQTQCAYTRVNLFTKPFKGFLFGFHNSRDRRVNTCCLLAGLADYISQVGEQTETSRGLCTSSLPARYYLLPGRNTSIKFRKFSFHIKNDQSNLHLTKNTIVESNICTSIFIER